MDPQKIHFHAIHRVGKLNRSKGEDEESAASPSQVKLPRPRPIIARFVSRMDRDEALAKKETLSNFSSVYIDQKTATEREKLREALTKPRS